MLQQIQKPISVRADFKADGSVIPRYFYFNGSRYDINKIELVYKKREGENIIYYFEATDSANYFKLAFYSLNLKWYLEAFQNE